MLKNLENLQASANVDPLARCKTDRNGSLSGQEPERMRQKASHGGGQGKDASREGRSGSLGCLHGSLD